MRNSIGRPSGLLVSGRQLDKMTPDLLEQARREVFHKLQVFKKPDGFHKRNRALFAFGTKQKLSVAIGP
jgi:hypothetical protein